MSLYHKILKSYQQVLKNHPTIVQSMQAGVLMGTGDIIAQTFVEEKPLRQIEPIRTAQFFTIGVGLVGPALTVWYRFLSRTIGDGGKSVALKKVALDQLLFAPSFMVVFITAINAINGHGVDKIKEELRKKYTDILITNYKIWPAVQLVNFYFVPLHYQVLLVQGVALIWNAYLSWKTNQ